MKKMVRAVLFAVMAVFSTAVFAEDEDSCASLPGSLTFAADGYYEIGTADALYKFACMVNGGATTINGRLTADICLNACGEGESVLKANGTLSDNASNFTQWTPIGTVEKPYTGTFDGEDAEGNVHVISGLYFNDESTEYVGLFGYIDESAKVQNVGVVDSYFKGCQYVGGVVGYSFNGTVSKVYNTGAVSGETFVGGVVGYNDGGTVSNVYNAGSVSRSGNDVGGVVGANYGTVSNAYNTGSVSGSGDDVGGVVGYNYNGTVSNVYNTGSVSGNGVGVGGVVGNNYGTVSNAYYNSEAFKGGSIGGGYVASENVKGKMFIELVALTFGTADADFPLLVGEVESPWIAGSGERPVVSNGKLVYKLPGLKDMGSQPELVVFQENAEGYYEISNAQELKWFAQLVNSGATSINGKLTANICVNACGEGESVLKADGTLNGDGSNFTQWTPIGTLNKPYKGTFDGKDAEGNAHVISGLYFNDENVDNVGLFGYMDYDAKVQNVGVVDSYIRGRFYVGGVVGYNDGTVSNSYNASAVNGKNQYVGGVVGYNEGTVSNVYNTGAVSGESLVGGVVGGNYGNVSNVYNAYNTGAVSGGTHVGGVVGYNEGTVSNVYNAGTVSGYRYVGGVVGENYVSLSNVYNTGAVSGESLVGGVVGYNEGDLSNAYYNTDFYAGNALGKNGGGSIENVDGKPTAELIAIDLGPEWVAGNLAYDKTTGKLAFGFPYLKNFGNSQYKITVLEFKVVDNVIQIANADDLKNFARLVSEFGVTDVDAKLTVDIVVNENLLGMDNANVKSDGTFDVDAFKNTHASAKPMAWTPIGTNEKPYTGTFDGNGKSISGLYFNDDTTAFVGVFGILDGAVVKNVGVEDSYFRGLGAVGAVVGLVAEGEVSNVYSKSIVSGKENVGGIVGVNVGKVADSDNMGSVSGKENVGGVAGTSVGKVMDSYNTGTVRGSLVIGGVVGHVRDKGQVDKVYNTGAVSGGKFVGGVIGYNDASFVGNMYNTGSVSGTDQYVGGVVGGVDNKGSVSNVYNMGSVSGSKFTIVGGVVGFDNSAIISNAYFDTDFYTGNALGSGEDVENVGGKTSAELAAGTSLKLDTTAWVVGAVSENVKRDTLYYPYLKVFGPHKYELSDVKKYSITVAVNDKAMGTVTGAGEYEYGTKVEISATAKKGYKFVKWSDGVKDAKRTITVTKAEKLTATFEKDSKKDAVVAMAQLPQFSVTASGKMVSIAGARPNTNVVVYDLQGNRVKSVVATSANFTFALPSAGVYIVKNGYTAKRMNVR